MMLNFLSATFCTLFQVVRRRRLLETVSGMDEGLKAIRGNRDRCKFCVKYRLIWYMVSAIKMKDPYKIVEINSLFATIGTDVKQSDEYGDYVMEAEAWTGQDEHAPKLSSRSAVPELLRKWRSKQLAASDLGTARNASSRLRWPLQIVMGSIFELKNENELAIQYYRRAFSIMPRWLPEAKIVHEKINELRSS